MIETILWIGGGAVAFLLYCRLTGVCAWYSARDYSGRINPPAPEDWVLGGLFAALGLPLLPLILVLWLGRRWLLKPPETARLEMQKRRIKQLERELDVR